MLAMTQVRVGLATVLDDDRLGRASLAEVASLGVDVGGARLASPATDFVVADVSGAQSFVFSERSGTHDLEIPAAWSSQVLLLSGLSAITSRLAAFCKAARSARRDGAVVVLDVVSSMWHWAGRDPRVIAMVLREADIVRCSLLDLAAMGTDSAAVRRQMRSNATLVLQGDRAVTAMGRFGEVRVQAPREAISHEDFAERCTAAVCAEFARPRAGQAGVGESAAGRWHRVLHDQARRLAGSGRLARRPDRARS
jgi:sugar/nucleoside kinase (ribokinase family)